MSMSEREIAAVVAERDRLREEVIGGAFNGSRYVADRMAIPPDIVRARFGTSFVIERGVVVGKRPDGGTIFSKSNPGEPAPFDEALEAIVEAYPYRDNILRSSGASGYGVRQSDHVGSAIRAISRTAFDALDGASRMAHIKSGGTVHD